MTDRFIPPDDARSLREVAEWLLSNSVDTESDEAATIYVKYTEEFREYFIEKLFDDFVLLTRYLDDGDVDTLEEESNKEYVAVDWSSVSAIRWTTKKPKLTQKSALVSPS